MCNSAYQYVLLLDPHMDLQRGMKQCLSQMAPSNRERGTCSFHELDQMTFQVPEPAETEALGRKLEARRPRSCLLMSLKPEYQLVSLTHCNL